MNSKAQKKADRKKVKPARLDADGTAIPKTRLVAKVNPKHCVPHGGIGAYATDYENESGERIPLEE